MLGQQQYDKLADSFIWKRDLSGSYWNLNWLKSSVEKLLQHRSIFLDYAVTSMSTGKIF